MVKRTWAALLRNARVSPLEEIEYICNALGTICRFYLGEKSLFEDAEELRRMGME
jgi:hypothetical protein